MIWHHFHAAFDDSSLRWYLRPILSGRSAVILFFVLSGYVLSLPVWRNRQQPYEIYLVRRFFRIYVPYAAAVLVALTGAHFFLNAQRPLSPWFYHTWHSAITARVILVSLLTTVSPVLNTAFWSLRYEVEMSILMPFLAGGMNHLGKLRSAAAIFSVGACFEVLLHLRQSNMGTLLSSLHYGLCFAYGALLSQNRESLKTWFEHHGTLVKIACLTLTIVLFYSDSEALCTLGAGTVILLALHSRASRWLRTPIPEYLGWISYSMYLVHGTVLFVLLILFVGRIPVWALAMLYVVCVFGISHLFCTVIEQPSLQWGRRLTTSMKSEPEVLVPEQGPGRVSDSA